MTRYYFDVQDDASFVIDDEGLDLLDITDAQMEPAGFLADFAKDLSTKAANPSGHPLSIEVRDNDGPLFLVRFSLLKTHSMSG